MRNYQYINRERVNPIDLNLLGQTYNTLEQGHLKAVEAASELQTAMASLDLNEAEDAWRQQRINEIRQTIADNTTFGNAYGALDDIIAKRGDLTSDVGLIGRLRAQQDYKVYQQKVDSSNIPEHYKDYYKKLNPYYYQDKYDNKGNVIGGSKWESNSEPVATQDYNTLMQLAIKYASPHKSNSIVTRYLNADNSITTTPKDPNATPVLYDTTTYSIQELTKEDLRSGLEAALKGAPEYLASLQQDYKIALDDYKNNNNGLYNVKSAKGGHMTFEEFKNSIFEPMYDANSYKYINLESQKSNTQLLKDYNAAFGNKSKNSDYYDSSSLLPYANSGDNINYRDRSVVLALNGVKNADKELRNIYQTKFKNNPNANELINSISVKNPAAFKNILPQLLGETYSNLNIDLSDRNAVLTALSESGRSEQDVELDMEYYDSIIEPYKKLQVIYAEDIHNANKFNEQHGGTKSWAAVNTMSSILSGEFKSENDMDEYEKRFYNEYSNLIDQYFPEDSTAMIWTISDEKANNSMNEILNNNPLLKKYVEITTSTNGDYAFILSKDHKELFYEFADAITQARNSRNKWHKQWQDIKSEFSTHGDHLGYISTDGKNKKYTTIPVTGHSKSSAARYYGSGNFRQFLTAPQTVQPYLTLIDTGIIEDTEDILQGAMMFRDRLNRYTDDKLTYTEKPIEALTFTGATPQAVQAYADNAKANELGLDNEELAKYIRNNNTIIDGAKETILNNIKSSGFVNCKIKQLNDEGLLIDLHGEELNELRTELITNAEDSQIDIMFDPEVGKFVNRVSYNYKDEDDKINHRVFTIEYSEDGPLNNLNNDPYLNSRKDFMLSYVENRDIRIGNYMGENDIYAVPISKGIFGIQIEGSDDFKHIIDTNTKQGKNDLELLIRLNYLTDTFNNFVQYYYGIDEKTSNDIINEYKSLLGYFTNIDISNKDIRDMLDKSIEKECIY